MEKFTDMVYASPELTEVTFTDGQDKTKWQDGLCYYMDEGRKYVSVYLGHESETVTETDEEGNSTDVTKVYALQIRVDKPLTRAKVINRAESLIYHLNTAEEIASFGTSLARKSRLGEDTEEITEHDEMVAYVKSELDKFGIN